MRSKWILESLCAAFLLAFLATGIQAQFAAGDWPFYRGDLEGQGYSALKQINSKNVSTLKQSWSFPLSERGGLEVTPIAVNGVMYLPGTGKIYALDGATGKEIWHYDVQMAPTRGVAYWPGDRDT